MIMDTFEADGLSVEKPNISEHLKMLHKGFETKTKPTNGYFQRFDSLTDENLSRMLGIEDTAVVAGLHPTLMDETRRMLYGVERNGSKTMGLEDISKWKLDQNSVYYNTNLKQQAGYTAEIISTCKENVQARAKGLDLRTYRADDIPGIYKRNDQYVDKVRVNSEGQIVERIQTKFFGKNGKDWVDKMMSSKCDKYLDGAVDKLECPSDYYDDAKAAIEHKLTKLDKQFERVTAEGKTDVAGNIQYRIDKLNKIDQMIEKSTVSTEEARYARLHSRRYASKMFAPDLVKVSNTEGLKGSAFAAGITFTVSAVDHISDYMDGCITAEEMVSDISKETATAGALGYGTAFISTAVSQALRTSSCQLIRTVGGSCLPTAAVSFAVESYDSISDYAQGDITAGELANDLGESASAIAGGIKGAGLGASVGSAAGPVGTVAGGVVGGVVGCVVATEVYETAVDLGVEGAQKFAEKAQKFANAAIDTVAENAPQQLDNVKAAFSNFASSVNLPFSV